MSKHYCTGYMQGNWNLCGSHFGSATFIESCVTCPKCRGMLRIKDLIIEQEGCDEE